MAKTILKLTNNSAGVKIAAAGAETIDLDVDLLLSTEVLNASTPTVNIQRVMWCGAAGSTITITRNGVDIMNINSEVAGKVDFNGFEVNDTVENDQDIVVTVTGDAEAWIILRKLQGYATTFEPEQYGSHDNPTVEGS